MNYFYIDVDLSTAKEMLGKDFVPDLTYKMIIDNNEIIIAGFKDDMVVLTETVDGPSRFTVSDEDTKKSLYDAGVYSGSITKSTKANTINIVSVLLFSLLPLLIALAFIVLIKTI